jgi:hypothetical protein
MRAKVGLDAPTFGGHSDYMEFYEAVKFLIRGYVN